MIIRSPQAIRPWQHVLEPLSGYLTLAEKLHAQGRDFAQAWNFGPDEADARPVRWVVERLCEQVRGAEWRCGTDQQPHEAGYLKLDSSKARARLGWFPRWDLGTALDNTLLWHQAWKKGADMAVNSLDQIHAYESANRS